VGTGRSRSASRSTGASSSTALRGSAGVRGGREGSIQGPDDLSGVRKDLSRVVYLYRGMDLDPGREGAKHGRRAGRIYPIWRLRLRHAWDARRALVRRQLVDPPGSGQGWLWWGGDYEASPFKQRLHHPLQRLHRHLHHRLRAAADQARALGERAAAVPIQTQQALMPYNKGQVSHQPRRPYAYGYGYRQPYGPYLPLTVTGAGQVSVLFCVY
jgi:hypothetical protein